MLMGNYSVTKSHCWAGKKAHRLAEGDPPLEGGDGVRSRIRRLPEPLATQGSCVGHLRHVVLCMSKLSCAGVLPRKPISGWDPFAVATRHITTFVVRESR